MNETNMLTENCELVSLHILRADEYHHYMRQAKKEQMWSTLLQFSN